MGQLGATRWSLFVLIPTSRPIVMVDDVVLVGFDGDADAERAR